MVESDDEQCDPDTKEDIFYYPQNADGGDGGINSEVTMSTRRAGNGGGRIGNRNSRERGGTGSGDGVGRNGFDGNGLL